MKLDRSVIADGAVGIVAMRGRFLPGLSLIVSFLTCAWLIGSAVAVHAAALPVSDGAAFAALPNEPVASTDQVSADQNQRQKPMAKAPTGRESKKTHGVNAASRTEDGDLLRDLGGLAVRGFQKTVSRVDGDRCRMAPTCSVYGAEAIKAHGLVTGTWLLIDRLLRETGGDDMGAKGSVNGRPVNMDPLSDNDFWLSPCSGDDIHKNYQTRRAR